MDAVEALLIFKCTRLLKYKLYNRNDHYRRQRAWWVENNSKTKGRKKNENIDPNCHNTRKIIKKIIKYIYIYMYMADWTLEARLVDIGVYTWCWDRQYVY